MRADRRSGATGSPRVAPRRACSISSCGRRPTVSDDRAGARRRRRRPAGQGAGRPARRDRQRLRARPRSCATRSGASGPAASSRSPPPTASASSSSGNEGYYLATAFERDRSAAGGPGRAHRARRRRCRSPATCWPASASSSRSCARRVQDGPREPDRQPALGPNREMLDALLDTLQRPARRTASRKGAKLPPAAGAAPDRPRALLRPRRRARPRLVDRLRYATSCWTSLHRLARPPGQSTRRLCGAAAGARRAGRERGVRPRRRASIRAATARSGRGIAADDLAGAARRHRRRQRWQAVLLRVDSGGGSAVASETIGTRSSVLRQAGKPVIVSMGNAAASGGYWIAHGADRIVAQPATLTGSIGVIAGKPDLRGAWDQLGVRWAEITRGANADIWSLNQPYTRAGPGTGRAIWSAALRRASRPGSPRAASCRPERVDGDRQGPRLGRRDGAGARPGRRAGRPRRGPGRGPPRPAAAARGAASTSQLRPEAEDPAAAAAAPAAAHAVGTPWRALSRGRYGRRSGTAASLPLTRPLDRRRRGRWSGSPRTPRARLAALSGNGRRTCGRASSPRPAPCAAGRPRRRRSAPGAGGGWWRRRCAARSRGRSPRPGRAAGRG